MIWPTADERVQHDDQVYDLLLLEGGVWTTHRVADRMGWPLPWALTSLERLAAHDRIKRLDERDGHATLYGIPGHV